MSAVVSPKPVTRVVDPANELREVTIYEHSNIFYWWPVWALGYTLALLTYLQGSLVTFRVAEVDRSVWVHPSHNLGVIFTVVFLLVILMTHFSVRGVASLTVIISAIAVTLFLAYMDWWGYILEAMGNLAIYMNLGFYMFFSTALLIVWGLAILIFDRTRYWKFRPGQMIEGTIFGAGEHAYDTRGMVIEKMRDDLFRHWVLGLGSGDLHISITGAVKADILLRNVLFVGHKVEMIQRLAAMKPDDDSQKIMTAGEPV